MVVMSCGSIPLFVGINLELKLKLAPDISIPVHLLRLSISSLARSGEVLVGVDGEVGVFVGGKHGFENIPLGASTEDLKAFCESIGEITEVRVVKGKDSSKNKRFGFVTFKNVELAAKTIKELNNKVFRAAYEKAKKQEESSSSRNT
ncbi:hypothetical protein PIB30_018716 [Stylosanthes scabra]|uniref:RRM domain-containing protein n=1 Tax=Stylosanthes scabra TaxID=79078 RepID=A0ABU6X814_9FABA|nr:hypothetical protein [Stylosanthes scabra]